MNKNKSVESFLLNQFILFKKYIPGEIWSISRDILSNVIVLIRLDLHLKRYCRFPVSLFERLCPQILAASQIGCR